MNKIPKKKFIIIIVRDRLVSRAPNSFDSLEFIFSSLLPNEEIASVKLTTKKCIIQLNFPHKLKIPQNF